MCSTLGGHILLKITSRYVRSYNWQKWVKHVKPNHQVVSQKKYAVSDECLNRGASTTNRKCMARRAEVRSKHRCRFLPVTKAGQP